MRAIAVGLAITWILAACGAPAATPAAATAIGAAATAAATAAAGTATTTTAAAPKPAFLSYAFSDVRDGKSFKLTDFPGKSVLVIGMAVW